MIFKTKEEIEIEFCKANDQAAELEKIAEELSNIANTDVNNALSIISESFQGENGKNFFAKGKAIPGDIFDAAQELLKIAKTIRETSDIIYRAEKRAIGLF